MKKPKTLKNINLLKYIDSINGTEEKLANEAIKLLLREISMEWIRYYLKNTEIQLQEYYLQDMNYHKISQYFKSKGKIEAIMEFFDISKEDVIKYERYYGDIK